MRTHRRNMIARRRRLLLDGSAPDVNFTDVVLLLDMAGNDGDKALTDLSNLAQTITVSGTNHGVDETYSYFGSDTSYEVAGSDESIACPAFESEHDLRDGDFTMEMDVRFSSTPGAEWQTFMSKYQSPNDRNFIWGYNNGNMQFLWSTTGWSDTGTVNVAWTPSASTWYRIALVRDGVNLHFYVDGTRIGTDTTISTDDMPVRGTAKLTMTRASSVAVNHFAGNMDNVRLTKGVARYTGESYTLDTEPFPTS